MKLITNFSKVSKSGLIELVDMVGNTILLERNYLEISDIILAQVFTCFEKMYYLRGLEKQIITFRTGSLTRIKNGGRCYEN